MQPLNPREQLFVTEYLINPIGAKAAIAAGYKASQAKQTAHKLLRKAHIREAINAAQAVRTVNSQIKAEMVIEELARVGFADITIYFDESGRLKPMSEWPQNAGHMIASVKTQTRIGEDDETITITELKLWDKIGALDKLAKHFGLLLEHKAETPEEKFEKMTKDELNAFISEALRIGSLNMKVVSEK